MIETLKLVLRKEYGTIEGKQLKRVFILLTLIASLISLLASAYSVGLAKSAPSTVFVPDQYPTIQAAINAAGSGDIVYVKNGTYIENVVINKTLSLVGENKRNTTIEQSQNFVYSIISITADGVNVTGFTIQGGSDMGVSLNNVSHCNVYGNNIENTPFGGIKLDSASNNTIAGNNIANIMNGIVAYNSYHNSMLGNNIAGANNGAGILLGNGGSEGPSTFSNYNSVIGNNITANVYGISIGTSYMPSMGYPGFSNFNSVIGNNISNNYGGIQADSNSSGNTLYHNNFVDNTGFQVVFSEGSPNTWDDGYPSGGNYWSDYSGVDQKNGPEQNVTGGDGIGDTPYAIASSNMDRYPLMGPFKTFNAGTWNNKTYHVDTDSKSNITDFRFNSTARTLSFNVTGKNGTMGFCRIAIPLSFMSCANLEEWIVIVNGTMPIERNITTDANYTYIYFTYQQSTELVQIKSTSAVPELQSQIILVLVVMATLLAALVYKRRHNQKE